MPLDPGPETRCHCGAKLIRQNTAELVGGVVHRTEKYCYNMNDPQKALSHPGSFIVARYIGSEFGRPFKKEEIYTLTVVEMSVFDDDGRIWYTYPSLEQFFKNWIVTGCR